MHFKLGMEFQNSIPNWVGTGGLETKDRYEEKPRPCLHLNPCVPSNRLALPLSRCITLLYFTLLAGFVRHRCWSLVS